MGDTLTIALVANTTSRYPFATGEWRGHFKNVGMYSRRIAYRDTCYMNKQVLRILEITFGSEEFEAKKAKMKDERMRKHSNPSNLYQWTNHK